MANIRIKDLANTASSTASDDFIGIDGATNGTRKLNAYSPSFGGNATVAGTLTVSGGSVTLTGAAYPNFYSDGSSGGAFTIRKAGVAYGTIYGNETNTILDSAGSANLILQTGGATRGTFTSSGLTVNATTASTSTSTGALVVGGGVGVAGAMNVGSKIAFAAQAAGTTLVDLQSTDDAVILGFGGVTKIAFGGNLALTASNVGRAFAGATEILRWGSGVVNVYPTTASTSTSSGALVVSGGVGVAGNINAGALASSHSITGGDTGPGTSILQIKDGVGTVKVNFRGNGNIDLGSTTASTSTSTGALVVGGGVGVAGAAYVGGNATVFGTAGITINNVNGLGNDSILTLTQSGVSNAFIKNTATTGDIAIGDGGGTYLRITKGVGVVSLLNTSASTSTSTGALVVSGGVGVAGAVYAGGKVVVNGGDAGAAQFAVASASGTLVANLTAGSTTNQSFGVRIFAGTSASDYGLFLRNVTDTTTLFKVDGVGGTTVGGSVTTAAPAGGTAAAWKLGTVATVSPTSPNRTIEVDIGGTIYYIHAKTTNN